MQLQHDPHPVAVLIGQLHQGGSERQLYYFLRQCDRRHWQPHVFVAGEDGDGCWSQPIRDLGISVTQLSGGRTVKLLEFRRQCQSRDIRMFLSWSSYTNVFGLALAGMPVARAGSFRSGGFDELPRRGRSTWRWLSVRSVSTIYCNSDETSAEVQHQATPKQRVFVVPNAVEPPPDPQQRRLAWRRRLGLTDTEVLIAGVGGIRPVKNFERFVDAVAAAARTRPVRAVIAGKDMGTRAAVERRIADIGLAAGTIQILDAVPDGRDLLSASDIYLLSSDVEGMPNVVMEAMSVGVPAVATPVNGVRSLITDGYDGYVAAPDPAALADRLITLVDDGELRRVMGGRAKRRMNAFSPPAVYGEMWQNLPSQVRNT